MEHPWNELVPRPKTYASCHVTTKPQNMKSENFAQLYLWLWLGADTGDSFHGKYSRVSFVGLNAWYLRKAFPLGIWVAFWSPPTFPVTRCGLDPCAPWLFSPGLRKWMNRGSFPWCFCLFLFLAFSNQTASWSAPCHAITETSSLFGWKTECAPDLHTLLSCSIMNWYAFGTLYSSTTDRASVLSLADRTKPFRDWWIFWEETLFLLSASQTRKDLMLIWTYQVAHVLIHLDQLLPIIELGPTSLPQALYRLFDSPTVNWNRAHVQDETSGFCWFLLHSSFFDDS